MTGCYQVNLSGPTGKHELTVIGMVDCGRVIASRVEDAQGEAISWALPERTRHQFESVLQSAVDRGGVRDGDVIAIPATAE